MTDPHNVTTETNPATIRRQALLDAAKAVCGTCNKVHQGIFHATNLDGKHWYACSSPDHPDGHTVDCIAAPIHAMIRREQEQENQL